jgi:membrane fusion protein (multidrug efflux system)
MSNGVSFPLKRKYPLHFFSFLLFGLFLSAGCSKQQEPVAAASEKPSEFAVSVTVAPVIRGNIKSTIRAVGQVKAINQAKISTKVPGKVEKISCDVGDRVNDGCCLLQLEKVDFELAVRQAEAALQMAEANYSKAKLDWERAQQLFDQGISSQQQFDLTKSAFEIAEASLAKAKADLDLANNQLVNADVTTLVGGTVTQKFVDLGERISPGQTLFEVAEISRVEVEVGVTDKRFSETQIGQLATISVDGYPGREFEGKVERIQPAIDPTTRTFKVTIGVDNPKELLKPGMLARVEITVNHHPDALIMPKSALLEEEGKYLVVAVRDGRAERLEIVPGFQDGERLEVLSGLVEGDQVVTEGAYGLAHGAAVRVSGG